MLTFEGTPIQGVKPIIEKLTVGIFLPLNLTACLTPILISSFAAQSLPFQKVLHKVTTRDAQPSSPSVASLIVNVTGLLVVSTDRKSPGAFILALALITRRLSRSTTARTHCSSLRCSILSQRVGATTCTYILTSALLGN
jgi:hypothetical protein